MKTRITLYIQDDVLRSARALASRQGKEEREVFEEALRRRLGLDILERVSRRSDLEEHEALEIAYDELHRARDGRLL